jgi:hypothetical protein
LQIQIGILGAKYWSETLSMTYKRILTVEFQKKKKPTAYDIKKKIGVQNIKDKGRNSLETGGLWRIRGKILILYPKILLEHVK